MDTPYNQEDEDYTCVHCEGDPCRCFDAPQSFSVQRMLGILARMQGIGGVHYIAPTVPLALLTQGDLGDVCEREFAEWLNTAQGKFATYLIHNEGR